jgi:hypothetical protein
MQAQRAKAITTTGRMGPSGPSQASRFQAPITKIARGVKTMTGAVVAEVERLDVAGLALGRPSQ